MPDQLVVKHGPDCLSCINSNLLQWLMHENRKEVYDQKRLRNNVFTVKLSKICS